MRISGIIESAAGARFWCLACCPLFRLFARGSRMPISGQPDNEETRARAHCLIEVISLVRYGDASLAASSSPDLSGLSSDCGESRTAAPLYFSPAPGLCSFACTDTRLAHIREGCGRVRARIFVRIVTIEGPVSVATRAIP